MSDYQGDYLVDGNVFVFFETYSTSTGGSISPTGFVVSDVVIYKNGSIVPRSSTAGIALIGTGIDVDGVVGYSGFSVDLSDDTDPGFYASGSDYSIVVNSILVNGEVTVLSKQFSIENRSGAAAVRPTVAGRTLDVAATGEAGIDLANINIEDGAISPLGITDNGTAQSASATTIQLRAGASFSDDEIIGQTVVITSSTTGNGQSRIITDYVSATNTATVDSWTTTPTGTITYEINATPPSSTGAPIAANVVQVSGVAEDLVSNTELNSRTLASADYFDPAIDVVSLVNTVNTCTSNTDMRGTDNALLSASYTAPDNAGITANGIAISLLNDISVSDIYNTQMVESYATDGITPTLAQSLFNIQQNLGDFIITGTTVTVRELDGATVAMTYTLDDAVNPTSKTRTT